VSGKGEAQKWGSASGFCLGEGKKSRKFAHTTSFWRKLTNAFVVRVQEKTFQNNFKYQYQQLASFPFLHTIKREDICHATLLSASTNRGQKISDLPNLKSGKGTKLTSSAASNRIAILIILEFLSSIALEYKLRKSTISLFMFVHSSVLSPSVTLSSSDTANPTRRTFMKSLTSGLV
jgi:hypothetical protein